MVLRTHLVEEFSPGRKGFPREWQLNFSWARMREEKKSASDGKVSKTLVTGEKTEGRGD